MPLDAAYAACERLAADHYENFPVASRLVPARMRRHIAAVYAFARIADDFADEEGYTLAERHLLLDDWRARLRAYAGIAGTDVPAPHSKNSPERNVEPERQFRRTVPAIDVRLNSAEGNVEPERQFRRTSPINPDLVFEALAHTITTCALDVRLFEDLLSAFRQDTVVKRYATWDDVLDYCRRSANPVGRLVLRIAGYRDATLDESSDALCTALQLTNFWQDLAVDWRRGRLYVPLIERDAAGAADGDLDAARVTPAWRAALAAATTRTRELFDRGRPVCDGVRGRLRYELRLTWVGATRVLDKLEASGFDAFHHRPSLGTADTPALAWGLLAWRKGGRG